MHITYRVFRLAKAYNIPDSHLYKIAVKLQKMVHNKVQELLGPDGDEESSNDDIIIPKRSATNTPIPTLSLEGDMILDEQDDHPSRSMKTPTVKRSGGGIKGKSNKESFGYSGVQGAHAQVVATTVPPSKSSPTNSTDERNKKTLAYKELLKKRFLTLYQAIIDYVVSCCSNDLLSLIIIISA